MISSLQQLHSAARQTRNFLSNFQVAFRRNTPGQFFRFERFSAKVRKSAAQFVCLDLRDLVNELKQKEEKPLRVV